MDYDKLPIRRIRSIEMLTIDDVREIVIRDLERYGVPIDETGKILRECVTQLENETDKLKKKYYPDYR